MRPSALLGPVLLLAVAPGCAHAPRAEIRRPAAEGRCEAAAEQLARHPPGQTPGDEFRQVFTQPLSYVVAGTGYAIDGALLVGMGVVGGGLVCLPAGALGAALRDDELFGACFESVFTSVLEDGELPGAGRGLAHATRRWRCPDRTRLARETRTVAACFRRRGTRADLETAWDLVSALDADPRVARCLSHRERRADARDLAAIEAALEAAWDLPPPPPPPPAR